jgi:GT2 family glycosyltransferase
MADLAISVVVPTYNRRDTVARSLETMFEQTISGDKYEVIVVIDGSTDGTADALRRVKASCRFRVIEQENRGSAGARNTGFRAAESNLVLFLDDDMRCDRDLVSSHVAAHRRFGDAVVFGAIFLSSDSKASLATECFKREIGAFHLNHSKNRNIAWQIEECVFSNSSLPKRILEETGGFDESFRMREDFELGIRLVEMGVRTEYVSEAIAHQYYEKTAADLLADAEAFGLADRMVAHKHPNRLIAGHVGWQESNSDWKGKLRETGVRWPFLETCFLGPLCFLGERLYWFPLCRAIGVRSLQLRRRIRWSRATRKAG